MVKREITPVLVSSVQDSWQSIILVAAEGDLDAAIRTAAAKIIDTYTKNGDYDLPLTLSNITGQHSPWREAHILDKEGNKLEHLSVTTLWFENLKILEAKDPNPKAP